jgi:superfamily II DNA or RNA helicase
MMVSGSELGIPTHPYTAGESSTVRREILRDFSTGRGIRVLASMRCLDEGVDIPDARIAYMLASSSNPRQFIQRRGRVLRRADGKTRADIIDFVAVPPGEAELYEIERKLFRREVERCVEFARYAENQGFALAQLRELRERYDLMGL